MHRKSVMFAVLLATSLSVSTAFSADSTTAAAAISSHGHSAPAHDERPNTQLTGTASFNLSERDFLLGNRALDARLYNEAHERLSRALTQLNKTRARSDLKALAHLGLAEANMALGNLSRAQLMLNGSKELCFETFGPESPEAARYYGDLAELHLANGKPSLATNAAKDCLRVAERGKDPQKIAVAQVLVGRALCEQSYYEYAKEYVRKALPVLEMQPGRDRLDYANALLELAIIEKKLGKDAESDEIMRRALALKSDAVVLDKTQDQKGLVKFKWMEGMYGSRQIVDPVYPLKYMVVGGVRVACTLVRSYKHLAVLVSLANCNKQPLQLAVGPLKLEKLSPGHKLLDFCDPGLIDEVLEEDVILDRTWRRRTLCHIQKSRKIPGYLKNGFLDPDDFFGNNVFGLYGAWDTNLRETPPIVTREQYFFDDRPKSADQELLGFMRGNGLIRPTFIEPGGARTAVVFFLRERYEDATVRIHIGNAELQFPFHVSPGQ